MRRNAQYREIAPPNYVSRGDLVSHVPDLAERHPAAPRAAGRCRRPFERLVSARSGEARTLDASLYCQDILANGQSGIRLINLKSPFGANPCRDCPIALGRRRGKKNWPWSLGGELVSQHFPTRFQGSERQPTTDKDIEISVMKTVDMATAYTYLGLRIIHISCMSTRSVRIFFRGKLGRLPDVDTFSGAARCGDLWKDLLLVK